MFGRGGQIYSAPQAPDRVGAKHENLHGDEKKVIRQVKETLCSHRCCVLESALCQGGRNQAFGVSAECGKHQQRRKSAFQKTLGRVHILCSSAALK